MNKNIRVNISDLIISKRKMNEGEIKKIKLKKKELRLSPKISFITFLKIKMRINEYDKCTNCETLCMI